MKKKKLYFMLGIIVVVLAIGITLFFVLRKDNNNTANEDVLNNGIPNTGLEVTGKLKEYIANLGDNYYIKYSGVFENNLGEPIQAIVEYTKSGENFAIRSDELDIHLVCIGNSISTISNKYQLVIKMPKDHVDTSKYNFVSDMGQAFAYEYKEKINNVECDVEEYMYNGKQLKYYFNGSEIKLIKYDTQEVKILRVGTSPEKEMLTVPTTYEIIDNT